MRFDQLYGTGSPAISFELFPPKTDKGMAALEAKLPRLIDLGPRFFSVTYGAMGTTQSRTLEIARLLRSGLGQEVAHHLTCVGATREEIGSVLDAIRAAGVENVVALRGDAPQGESEFQAVEGGFSHANELVAFIRERGDFGIAVAGYPETHVEASDAAADLGHLKRKVDAGADVVVTQLFYDNDDYFRFVDRCRATGIDVPVVAGLMPIRNVEQIKRITSMCGSRIPDALGAELEEAADDAERVLRVGIDHTIAQARTLIDAGAPGIHFYVLNQDNQIGPIMEALR